FETVFYYYDCSDCAEPEPWPASLGWDLDRDGKINHRDLLLWMNGLRGASAFNPIPSPWPYHFTERWNP
ncbi:MAG: hypothetical protein KC994_18855, partial [Candidatus Omnitrophica bacterium]|nr:hypothetical protein [Candidatus Omnitrophota bacterium]